VRLNTLLNYYLQVW